MKVLPIFDLSVLSGYRSFFLKCVCGVVCLVLLGVVTCARE